MKIGVTGGTGFLGKEVVKVLNAKAITVSLLNRKNENLLDSESLKNFVAHKDIIIHIAGANRATNYDLISVNTLSTLSLLEAIARYNPSTKIIFTSSVAIYADGVYGLSKRYAEELIVYYAKQLPLKAIILRLSNIYGKGGKPFYNSVIATFLHNIEQGQSLEINGNGRQLRDYIYISDVVNAIIKAIMYKPKNNIEIFDICSGELVSLKKIVKELQNISSKKILVNFNKTKIETIVSKRLSNRRAKNLLGWVPTVSIKEGLQKVLI